MFLKGFSSPTSHEAEVSYSRKLGLAEPQVIFLNELRYYRSQIRYYGKSVNREYARKSRTFMEGAYPNLKRSIA